MEPSARLFKRIMVPPPRWLLVYCQRPIHHRGTHHSRGLNRFEAGTVATSVLDR